MFKKYLFVTATSKSFTFLNCIAKINYDLSDTPVKKKKVEQNDSEFVIKLWKARSKNKNVGMNPNTTEQGTTGGITGWPDKELTDREIYMHGR